MSEMIERVRAAWQHAERFGRDPAEAAVKAMREPTPEMVVAGYEASLKGDVLKAWYAMIDAVGEEAE